VICLATALKVTAFRSQAEYGPYRNHDRPISHCSYLNARPFLTCLPEEGLLRLSNCSSGLTLVIFGNCKKVSREAAITHSIHHPPPHVTYVYKGICLGQGVENARVKFPLIEVGEAPQK
jgi:hypothetical protein